VEKMETTQTTVENIAVERISRVSHKKFSEIITAFSAAIGHPDIREFWKSVSAAKHLKELEQIVGSAIGPTGLMEFARFDHGSILAMEAGEAAPRIFRFLVGNPLIMKEMAKHVPDAGSYAPVTILIDERADGVHLSYDSMTSHLTPYGNLAALTVARELDSKIDSLLASAAE
jgi:uncharacterized protein (DUF302 family)